MQLPKVRKAAYATSSNPDSNDQSSRPRPAFSQQTFLHYLINFVVSDDQVHCIRFDVFFYSHYHSQSINVIECREFCDLLLVLHEDLQEKDIPRRTKLRESIIKAWERWFKILKKDLAVCFIFLNLIFSFN
jgi:hypothetical protein